MVEGVKDKDEFYNKCREYVEGYLKEHHEDIEKARENFQKLWEEVEEKFYDNILKDFDIEFPEEIKEIKATVSINPICPRNIDKWSFNVNYKQAGDRMKQTAVHEIIHFLYFKKWMAVFPDHDKKTFNNPHSQWKLSEMLVNPIINNNETIQEIINNQKGEGYSEFKNIKINNKTLNEFFGEIYKEHVEGKISFGDFLKRSWEEYQKHKDIIENYKK